MSRQDPISDALLKRAYSRSEACPPPERFLESESRALTSAQREDDQRHADGCPACAVERDLARSFDAPSEEAGDVGHVVARLSRQAAWGPTTVRRRRLPVGWLAAAAVLCVAVLGILRSERPGPPELPAYGGGAVTRGSHVDVLQPVGDLDAVPGSLSWREVAAATGYQVRILRVDDSVLWETSVDSPSAELSPAAMRNLRPRVSYFWDVVAVDASGARVAISDRVRFRVVPTEDQR